MEPEKGAMEALNCGYRHLELFLNCEYEFSDEYTDLFRHLAEEKNFHIGSVHPFTSLTEPAMLFGNYNRRRLEFLEKYKGMFRAASRLGAKYFILHGAGWKPTEYRELYPHELDSYRTLVAYGQEYGVRVLQENVRMFLSAFPDFFSYLKENVPDLGFNLDFKQAIRTGRPIEHFISAMSGNILNVHINDNDKENHCRLPGQGLLPYQELFGLLDKAGFDGALVTEVYRQDFGGIEEISHSRQFLETELAAYQLSKKYFG